MSKRKQCAKCPWKKTTNPHDIPNGYDVAQHRALKKTIATPGDIGAITSGKLHLMACHETHDEPCVGWLVQQLGPGNNIALRYRVALGHLDADVETVGEQHERFEDTLP